MSYNIHVDLFFNINILIGRFEMKILHVVMLFFLTISAPVIAQPTNDELGNVMQYLSINHSIKNLRASAIKCTQEAILMQQQLHKQGTSQREVQSWQELASTCQEVLHNTDRIESEAFASCVNNIDTEDDICYEHLVRN